MGPQLDSMSIHLFVLITSLPGPHPGPFVLNLHRCSSSPPPLPPTARYSTDASHREDCCMDPGGRLYSSRATRSSWHSVMSSSLSRWVNILSGPGTCGVDQRWATVELFSRSCMQLLIEHLMVCRMVVSRHSERTMSSPDCSQSPVWRNASPLFLKAPTTTL